MSSPSGVRLSELLGVLSFGVDLGMGQPMEHVLRQCLIALALAERIELVQDDRDASFRVARRLGGCHVDWEAACRCVSAWGSSRRSWLKGGERPNRCSRTTGGRQTT